MTAKAAAAKGCFLFMSPLTFTPINTITQDQVNQAQGNYNTDQGALTSANQNLSNFQNTMQSGQNMYQNNLASANQEAGYDPQQLTRTLGNLSQLQGIIGGLPQSISAQNSNYGATASNLAGQYSGQMSSLNPALNSQTQAATNELATQQGALQGAQNATTAQVTTQSQQLQGLQAASQAAQAQYATAQSQLSSLQQLFESQGQFNASEQASYEQANAVMMQAQAAMNTANANIKLIQSQTTAQNQKNQLAAGSAAYTMSPNSSGGFNYFNNGTPITGQQYAQMTGNKVNLSAGQPTAAATSSNSGSTLNSLFSNPSVLGGIEGAAFGIPGAFVGSGVGKAIGSLF